MRSVQHIISTQEPLGLAELALYLTNDQWLDAYIA
jgi:hypothetical protein